MKPNQIAKQIADKQVAFKRVFEIVMSKAPIYFIDEAVFTSKLQSKKVWTRGGRSPMVIYKPKLGFKAIAVVGAIDIKGRVRTICCHDYSINVDKFIQFLQELRVMKNASTMIYIFLDNLRVHYSLRVRQYCRENKIELVFNAAYSSEYNPIERLWALSKRIFQRKLAETNDHS